MNIVLGVIITICLLFVALAVFGPTCKPGNMSLCVVREKVLRVSDVKPECLTKP